MRKCIEMLSKGGALPRPETESSGVTGPSEGDGSNSEFFSRSGVVV